MKIRLNTANAIVTMLFTMFLGVSAAEGLERKMAEVPEADVEKITAAVPEQAPAKPKKERKILVFCRCEGFFHGCIPWCDVADEMSVFDTENLAQYNAILFNNTTALKFKDAAQRKALMDFVNSGKGIIGIHAATDNFYEWPEAATMMGGLFDGHPWTAGGTWAVKVDEPGHPLNTSFENRGFLIRDEIYQIKGPYSRDTHRVLLSLDMTNERNNRPGQKRADRDNAISWIKRHGNGRVFYCSLGHNNEIFWNPAVLGHYLAGIQYALGDLKADDVPSAQLKKKPAAALTTAAGGVDDPTTKLMKYTYGSNHSAWSAIDVRIRMGNSEENRRIENMLLRILSTEGTTVDAKCEICRLLRRVGTEKSVQPLAKLLPGKDTSHMARFALQGINSPRVDRVLLAALPRVSDDIKPGIIGTLGARGTKAAVKPLMPFVTANNPDIAGAAISALGRIGTFAAARVLQAAAVPAGLEELRQNALLLCADSLAKKGRKDAAMNIYSNLAKNGSTQPVRLAALRGEITQQKDKAAPKILRLLQSGDHDMQTAASELIVTVPGPKVTLALAAALPNLPPTNQLILLRGLSIRKDPAARKAVTELTGSPDEKVNIAAIRALGTLGDAKTVPLLVAQVTIKGGKGTAARESLEQLGAKGVTKAIADAVKESSDPGMQKILIEVLAERGDRKAVPVLLTAIAKHTDPAVRVKAADALRNLAGPEYITPIVSLACNSETKQEKEKLVRALIAVCDRMDNTVPAENAVCGALVSADILSATELVKILPVFGTAAALDAARAKLENADENLRKAVLRALGNWPDPAPVELLLKSAEKDTSASCRILALRGVVKLVKKPSDKSSMIKVEYLGRGIALAERPEEKKMLLQALKEFPVKAALQLTKKLESVPSLADDVRAISSHIRNEIRNRKLQLSASRDGGSVNNVQDGKQKTRWSTGRGIKPGDWFMIDLGEELTVKKIVLDTQGSGNDYPRGYEVYISKDGRTWDKKPVLTGKGTSAVTEITFEPPVRAHSVKIVQTDSEEYWHWSIHELTVDCE
jgi:type 1 glutamine amidotransferase/HEAT repeat protein